MKIHARYYFDVYYGLLQNVKDINTKLKIKFNKNKIK